MAIFSRKGTLRRCSMAAGRIERHRCSLAVVIHLLVVTLWLQPWWDQSAPAATAPIPKVAIHVSERTQALEAMPAHGATPTGPGTSGKEWWYSSWHYFVGYESMMEAFRSDGTPFVTVSDRDIAAGALLQPDGSPRYPILISLASEAIGDDEIEPLSSYIKAGGFVVIGAASFTRTQDGSYRSDFALAAAMGLHQANASLTPENNWNWFTNTTFTKNQDHRIVSHVPSNISLTWNMPIKADEISWGVGGTGPNRESWCWEVTPGGATVVASGDRGPLLAVNSHGTGRVIYYAAIQPIIGHGVTDPSSYAYFIFRKSVEWAFESFGLPLVKLSPWRFPYNAALMVRHDLEEYLDRVSQVEGSAQYEFNRGIKGEYYFCTGALRTYTGFDKDSIINGVRNAAASYGAVIGPHNGGLPNPDSTLTSAAHSYWHWGPDEIYDLMQFPFGYSSGNAYALTSVSNSFQDIKGWMAGIDNGRRGCGAANNCPRTWTSPFFNSTREASYEVLQQTGAITAGEQKLGPLPHFTLSYQKPEFRYPQLSLPTSDWFVGNSVPQALEWGHTSDSIRAAVDFYTASGGLINFYGHQLSNSPGIEQQYVDYASSKTGLWFTNAVEIYDWWLLRAPVRVNPTLTVSGYDYSVTASVTGAVDPATAVEITLPHPAGYGLANLQVYRDGVAAVSPGDFRNTNYGVKVLVGNATSSLTVTYSLYPPPSATPDSYAIPNGGVLQQAAPGVLANDAPLGAQLSATLVSPPSHGALSLNADGSFLYERAVDYAGGDSFSYLATLAGLDSAPTTVTLSASQVQPDVTWPTPAPLSYGIPLGSVQLNATASVPGTFSYSPAAGTILAAGSQPLSVTFTPIDTTSYQPRTLTRTVLVNKAVPTVGWKAPAPVSYGTAVGPSQLNASSTIPGTFSYTPSSGTLLPAGTHSLSVSFTPSDSSNYSKATAAVSLTVTKAAPMLRWDTPTTISYGTTLGPTQLNATADIAGIFSYTPAAGARLPAGNQTLSALFTPTDNANYTATSISTTLAVTKALPKLSWSPPSPVTYGTALGSAQLNATANQPGSFSYAPVAGTILDAGARPLKARFIPADSGNVEAATVETTLTVQKATPTISWSTPAPVTFGLPLGTPELNATALTSGTFSYDPPAGTVLSAGERTLVASFTPSDSTNYQPQSATTTIKVLKALPLLSWGQPQGITYGMPLGGEQLNATASVPGTFTYLPVAGSVLKVGSQLLSATFTPFDQGNYLTAEATTSLEVSKAAAVVTWNPQTTMVYPTPLGRGQTSASANIPGTFEFKPPEGSIPGAGTSTLHLTFTPTDGANYLSQTRSVTLSVVLPIFPITFTSVGNGSIKGSSSQNVEYGSTTTPVSAVPDLGYHFVNWSGTGGFQGSSDNPLTLVNVTSAQAITANFAVNTPTGDINGDGTVDIVDALLALRIAAGLDTATPRQLEVGDVAPLVQGRPKQDGKIDVGDVIVIMRKAVGLTTWHY